MSTNSGKPLEIEAVVTDIRGQKHNRFAVTRLTPNSPRPTQFAEDETITFSLIDWSGERSPQKGQLVRLSRIEKFSGGWRARLARPIVALEK